MKKRLIGPGRENKSRRIWIDLTDKEKFQFSKILRNYEAWEGPFYSLQFTDEERNQFSEILRDYDKEKIKEFINTIELQSAFLDLVREQPSPINHRGKLVDMIKILEKVHQYLVEIVTQKRGFTPVARQSLKHHNSIEDYFKSPHVVVNKASHRNARLAIGPVQKLIENLKSAFELEKRKRGQKNKADQMDVVLQLAIAFKKFIARPQPCSGPFVEIVCYYLEINRIKRGKGEDHTRAIRQALKKLSSPESLILS